MSYPRLVGTEVSKWTDTDINAAVNILRGFTPSGSFTAPYKYVVTNDGTDTYASNAYQTIYGGPSDTGGVDGADATAVINAALANCTAGRSWKERVAIFGSYTITSTLTVPAYTILDLYNAKLTVDAGFTDEDLIKLNGLYCDVAGGHLDGSSISVHGIRGFYGDATIRDTQFTNFGLNSASIWATYRDCANILFLNLRGQSTVAGGWPLFALTNVGSAGLFKTFDANFTSVYALGTVSDGGFLLEGDCYRTTFNHCVAKGCTAYGFLNDDTVNVYGYGIPHNTLYVNCNAYGNTGPGFATESAHTKYVNCTSEANTYDGFFLNACSNYTNIENCTVVDNGSGDVWGRANGITLEGVTGSGPGASYVTLANNVFIDNQAAGDNERYAFSVGNACDVVKIGKAQTYVGSGFTNLSNVNSGATNVMYPSFTLPFFLGSPTAGPYTVTNYEFEGWEVDDAAEFVATYFTLPDEVTQLVELDIDAYSVVTEADAMMAQVVMYGGAPNEAQNTHDCNGSLASNTTNFTAGDNIRWKVTNALDVRFDDFGAGDSCRLHVLYNAADGGNCATDARFKSLTVKYL